VAAEPAPAPAAPEIAQNTAPATPEVAGEANREELPHTSAGWLMMLLSGGSLSGVGLMLRRRS
jgi:LPXTG-motif cell wall-anchored protein